MNVGQLRDAQAVQIAGQTGNRDVLLPHRQTETLHEGAIAYDRRRRAQ